MVEQTRQALWTPAAAGGADPPPGGPDDFPLSLQQEFLRLVDTGDEVGPFSAHYTIVGGWRVRGPLRISALQQALDDLVDRHEALRTELVRGDDSAYQRVLAPRPVRLSIRDLAANDPPARDRAAEELVNKVESERFEMAQQPQLTAVLGRFDGHDAVLVLVAHHTGVDGWSMQLIVRDLASLYAARRSASPPRLPAPRQYRHYVAWQREHAVSAAAATSRDYWRRTLAGARITSVPTDFSRGAEIVPTTAYYRDLLPERVRLATSRLAAGSRTSPFMVLLAAYALMLREWTGQQDVVAATFTPGRRPGWVLDTVGSFYDLVPLRIDLGSCRTGRDLVREVRRACLAAYAHELPFLEIANEAPELMEPAAGDRAACSVFQAVQSPHIMADEQVGDLRYTAMRRRLISQRVGSAVPDGVLWSLEPHQPGIVASIGYTTNLFGEITITWMAGEFQRVLESLITDPDTAL